MHLNGQSEKGQTIHLPAADGFKCLAYVVMPAAGQRARGGVVILQEIFGVNSHIRAVAERYAAAGYMAIAPALFHRVQSGVDLGYEAADREAGKALKASMEAMGVQVQGPGALVDIQAASDHVAQAGKVAVVG
jgi:carboxymethylenebutenolidase